MEDISFKNDKSSTGKDSRERSPGRGQVEGDLGPVRTQLDRCRGWLGVVVKRLRTTQQCCGLKRQEHKGNGE